MASLEVKSGVQAISDDGGYGSRKFWGFVGSVVAIMLAAILACIRGLEGLGPNLGTVVTGVLGAYGIYCGANTAMKFAAAGVQKAAGAPTPVVKKAGAAK